VYTIKRKRQPGDIDKAQFDILSLGSVDTNKQSTMAVDAKSPEGDILQNDGDFKTLPNLPLI
jgi:hypothetical protein